MFGIGTAKKTEFKLQARWQHTTEQFILDLAWSPCGKKLALVTVEGQVVLIDQADQDGIHRCVGSHSGGATSVSWRYDGREFATSGQDGVAKIWNAANGELLVELLAGSPWVSKVAYHPRNPSLATAAGKILRIWTQDRQVAYESQDHQSTIADIGWNPDGSSIAAAAYFGISLHVPGRRAEPRKYQWKGSSLALAWSPDSQYIATGEQDSTVHFWKVKSGEDAQMWGFVTKVLELAWHHSGGLLATGGSDTIVLWDCRGKGPAGRQPRMFEGHPTRITQLAFQHRGDRLASGDQNGGLLFWNLGQSREPIGGGSMPQAISRLAWAPNDQCIAVGHSDGTIAVLGFAS